MKRTNLMLDDKLLEEATRVLGVKTYSAAVNLALEEVLRLRKIRSLPQFFGRGLWEGNLREMREDTTKPSGARPHKRRGRQ
jgi:Arc/MetJ family transcription regulator